MNTKKRIITTAIASTLASTLLLGATSAHALQFSGVYVFGDSLSDSGYFRPALTALGVPATLVPTLGRFTTNPGPVWAETVAGYYGGKPAPSNAGGSNYAQGGAKVAANDSTSILPGAAQRSVLTQISEYLAAGGGKADPGALYSVWAGANDVLQSFAGIAGGTINSTTFLDATVGAEIQQVGRLQAAGAKYVLVFGMPDLGSTPQFAGLGAAAAGAATQISAGHNTKLWTGLAANGIKVIPVDTFSLLNDIKANAAAFGFTNTTGIACGAFPPFSSAASPSAQFCSSANLAAANAATTYLFADGVHPTTGAHAIIADFVESLIDGPNAVSLLAEVPLSTRQAHISALASAMADGTSVPTGQIKVFAAAEGGKYNINSNALSPQLDSKNRAVTVGITMRASDNVTVGLGLGKTTVEAKLGGYGKFDTDETVLSAFATTKAGPFYLTGTLSIADIAFNSLQRNIKLGTVTRVASANTKGSNASGNIVLGYDFTPFNNLTVGPFASYTVQNIDVNGYDESNAGTANLHIGEQSRNSRISSLGLRASYTHGDWTPYLRVYLDREGNNRNREISATPLSLGSGNTYTVPGFKGDSAWVSARVGIRGRLTDNVILRLAYGTISSKNGEKQDDATATVSIGF